MHGELDPYQTKRREEISEEYSIGCFDFSQPIGSSTVYLKYERETSWFNDSQVSSIEKLEIFRGTDRLLKISIIKEKGLSDYSNLIKDQPGPKPKDLKTLERRLKAENLPLHVKGLLKLFKK
ncbi:hypothetical protein HYX16_04945 [Candidatus Woesearchaeota archaeon]|nr:hypothetical protein [Candidatus Woesearchaeota archaeon]